MYREFLKNIFYYFDLHSEYDKKKRCFNNIYNFYGIKFDISSIGATNYPYIEYFGKIPKNIIDSIDGIEILKSNGKSYLNITNIKSFIKLLIEIYNLSNKEKIDYNNVDIIYDVCKKRTLIDISLYNEGIDVNYLSNAAFDYYRNHVNSSITKDNIYHLIEDMDEDCFEEEKYENEEIVHSGTDFINAYFNKKTSTTWRKYYAYDKCFGYSILQTCSIDVNSDKELVNNFYKHFFGKNNKADEVIYSHESLSEFADDYSMRDINNIDHISIRLGRDIVMYNPTNGRIKLYVGFLPKIEKVANEEDKNFIYNLLLLINNKLNRDIKDKIENNKKENGRGRIYEKNS